MSGTIEVLRWVVIMDITDNGVTAKVECGHKFGKSETAAAFIKSVADDLSARLTAPVLDRMAEEGVSGAN